MTWKFTKILLRRQFRFLICLFLLALAIMPLAYGTSDSLSLEALLELTFLYEMLLIAAVSLRQFSFTMNREERTLNYSLPMTRRQLLGSHLIVTLILVLIPTLCGWLLMGILAVLRQETTVLALLGSALLISSAILLYTLFCMTVMLMARRLYQALLTIGLWTLLPPIVLSVLTTVLSSLVIHYTQLERFNRFLFHNLTFSGYFAQAEEILLLDTGATPWINFLVSGLAVMGSLALVLRFMSDVHRNERQGLEQSLLYRSMPALAASMALIPGSLTLTSVQGCLISITFGLLLYLLIQFLSSEKIRINRRMTTVLILEFLLIQTFCLGWRMTAGFGLTHPTDKTQVAFVTRFVTVIPDGKFAHQNYLKEMTRMTRIQSEQLINLEKASTLRYQRQGTKDSLGWILIDYRPHSGEIYSLRFPYYEEEGVSEILKGLEDSGVLLDRYTGSKDRWSNFLDRQLNVPFRFF